MRRWIRLPHSRLTLRLLRPLSLARPFHPIRRLLPRPCVRPCRICPLSRWLDVSCPIAVAAASMLRAFRSVVSPTISVLQLQLASSGVGCRGLAPTGTLHALPLRSFGQRASCSLAELFNRHHHSPLVTRFDSFQRLALACFLEVDHGCQLFDSDALSVRGD